MYKRQTLRSSIGNASSYKVDQEAGTGTATLTPRPLGFSVSTFDITKPQHDDAFEKGTYLPNKPVRAIVDESSDDCDKLVHAYTGHFAVPPGDVIQPSYNLVPKEMPRWKEVDETSDNMPSRVMQFAGNINKDCESVGVRLSLIHI